VYVEEGGKEVLKKAVMLGAIVAMVVMSAVPALALDGIDIGDGGFSSDGGSGILIGDTGSGFFDFDRNHDGLVFFEEPSFVPSGAAGPASQEFSERRITSGPATPSFTVSNSGNNANLCPAGQQTAQTGNVANEQGVIQDASKADDLDFTGSSITVTPSETATCTQGIEQAAAA
jgi:hypothetical protein